jgi:hypothetical protein
MPNDLVGTLFDGFFGHFDDLEASLVKTSFPKGKKK